MTVWVLAFIVWTTSAGAPPSPGLQSTLTDGQSVTSKRLQRGVAKVSSALASLSMSVWTAIARVSTRLAELERTLLSTIGQVPTRLAEFERTLFSRITEMSTRLDALSDRVAAISTGIAMVSTRVAALFTRLDALEHASLSMAQVEHLIGEAVAEERRVVLHELNSFAGGAYDAISIQQQRNRDVQQQVEAIVFDLYLAWENLREKKERLDELQERLAVFQQVPELQEGSAQMVGSQVFGPP